MIRSRGMIAAADLPRLAATMDLGALGDALDATGQPWRPLDHWQQGEFHHDVLFEVGGAFLVAATNCNGGLKELLLFGKRPDRRALWHWRCPGLPDFEGELPPMHGLVRTTHWFDPCRLLAVDARSELRAECRVRQPGGGWQPAEE